MGMQDLVKKLESLDHQKVAAVNGRGGANGGGAAAASGGGASDDDTIKIASFYDDLGRQLARGVFDDLVKQASLEERETKVAAELERIATDRNYAQRLMQKHAHLLNR